MKKNIVVICFIFLLVALIGCSSENANSIGVTKETLSFSDWKKAYREEIDSAYQKARENSDGPLSKSAFEIGAYTRYKSKK